MKRIKVEKYQGCGNDFLLVLYHKGIDYSLLAKRLCSRRKGIGADGLICVKRKPLEMMIFNQDGSKAPMCGNGIRCFSLYAYNHHYVNNESFEVLTSIGPYSVTITSFSPISILVNMGKASFDRKLIKVDKDINLMGYKLLIDGKEYTIEAVAFDDSEDGKILAEVSYTLPEEEIAINDEEAVAEEPAEKEPEIPAEEAGDAGEDEVIESLKEAVRQKDSLENEVRDLKNQKTVSDAEVQGLKEELEKYKGGFMRVSELASKSTTLEKEKKALTEQLNLKNAEIKDLKSKVENHISLTESAKAEKVKVTELTKKLAKVQAEAEETEKTLTEALEASRKKAQDRTNLAKSYKAKYDAVVERYIANKAKMLGVRPQDITSKLAESYSLDDIDNVCNDLLEESRPQFGLVGGNPRVRVNESVKSEKKVIDPDNGYEIDDDLLILAGLK